MQWFRLSLITLALWKSLSSSSAAFAQKSDAKSKNANSALGKVGKGKRNIQKKTCLVPVQIRGMNEGDLAEVIDAQQNRVAVVRLVRLTRPAGRLAAQVLVGEENCSSLSGYTIRPLPSLTTTGTQATGTSANPVASVAAQFMVIQFALPGLGLNKFLSPGYTQRGFGLRASGAFPRQPMQLGMFRLQAALAGLFSNSVTTPAIDIISNGQVLGTQRFSTTAIQLRAGARALTADSRLWTETGVILFDRISNKSSLAKSSESVDTLFAAIREFNGQGFGLYAEQGIVVGQNIRLSFWGGLGLGTKYKTPVLEDGDATNTSENFKTEGLPFYAGININIPVWRGAFSEINFDLSNVKLSLPLINEQQSKSQIERLSFSLGGGYRF